MTDWTENRKFMCWSFTKTSRMYQELWDYGYKIYQVGLFDFQVDATGTITGSIPTAELQRIQRWPHIRWLLTVRNDGYQSIFQALLDNTNGAQDKFLSEINRILDQYSSFAFGIDIDLERGGGAENREKAITLFRRIYQTVKARSSNRWVHVDLPAMTGPGETVGGEYWCDYAALEPYFDSCAIMSYGFAWAGSAPGPISPKGWMEDTYNYAVTVIPPEKIFMGLPAYGFRWQIDHSTTGYRGEGLTYLGCMEWLNGSFNHTNDSPPQPFIPFAGMYDWENMCPYAFLHVYDFLRGHDYDTREYPMSADTYQGRQFITCYSKTQKKTSTGVIVSQTGSDAVLVEGAMVQGDGYVAPREPQEIPAGTDPDTGETIYELEPPGHAVYEFHVPSSGYYDILVRVNFPWWDRNALDISLDGSRKTISESRLWYPYWRRIHWKWYSQRVYLSAGTHTLEVWGNGSSVYGTQFWGFEVATAGGHQLYAGEAEFTVRPRKFLDVNRQWVGPANGFKITLEVLRRDPDSALIWYEDFRDYGRDGKLPSSYYTVNSGSWSVDYDRSDTRARPYSWLDGSGDVSLNYGGFRDVHVRARIKFMTSAYGKAGVYVGNIYLCLNRSTQQVELYQGSTLVRVYATTISPNVEYQIEMRIRGSNVRVYTGTGSTFRFSATVSASGGAVGIRSDVRIQSTLLRIGDAWYYEPYEAIALQLPNGTVEEFGRIPRTGVTWDNDFQVFRVNSDVEESATRSTTITKEWDYVHSSIFQLTMNNDYKIKVLARDMNVWLSRVFLGDADGFSIMYYEDVDHFVHWANRAAYDWKLAGVAVWSLGQQDPFLFDYLPEVIPNPYE